MMFVEKFYLLLTESKKLIQFKMKRMILLASGISFYFIFDQFLELWPNSKYFNDSKFVSIFLNFLKEFVEEIKTLWWILNFPNFAFNRFIIQYFLFETSTIFWKKKPKISKHLSQLSNQF